MINDFLDSLECVRQEEMDDYQSIINVWKGKDNVIFFMPAISLHSSTFNLFDKKAKSDNKNMIWIIPAGQADFFLVNSLRNDIVNFYETDEMEYPNRACFPGIEAENFEECILLHSNKLQNNSDNTILDANTILYRLSLSSGRETLVFILLDHQDCCWKNIIEEYHIPLNWLVDSGRGMGNYFVDVNLYQLMKRTPYPEILPALYFKGLYNKGEIPTNFQFIYAMLSQPDKDGYDKWKHFSSVYATDWNC